MKADGLGAGGVTACSSSPSIRRCEHGGVSFAARSGDLHCSGWSPAECGKRRKARCMMSRSHLGKRQRAHRCCLARSGSPFMGPPLRPFSSGFCQTADHGAMRLAYCSHRPIATGPASRPLVVPRQLRCRTRTLRGLPSWRNPQGTSPPGLERRLGLEWPTNAMHGTLLLTDDRLGSCIFRPFRGQ